MQRSLLDRVVEYLSPAAASGRYQSRAMNEAFRTSMRGYDAASRGRRTDGWLTGSSSANGGLNGTLSLMRDRSRDLVRNNPYADRAIRVIASNTVGKGITPHARHEDDAIKKLYERLLIEWADDTLCDAAGVHNLYSMQALIMRTVAESGEALVLRKRLDRKSGQTIPLQLQVLEPEYLDGTKDRVNSDGSRIVHGIEFDANGRRVAYHLFNEHPGDASRFTSFASRRVAASEVLHIYRVDRAGQARGVPWGAIVILRLADIGDYEDAELIRQKIASCYTVFEHDIEGEDTTDDTTETAKKDAEGRPIERLTPGLIVRLGSGRTVSMSAPPVTGSYSPHSMAMLRSVAIGYGVSYEALTGHLGEVNFSSGRMGWLEFQRNIDQWQDHLMIQGFCRPVWRWFVESAVISGAAPKPCAAIWTPPRREMIDPVKETDAALSQVRAGFKSLQEIHRESGRDPDDVFRQLKEDKDKIAALGLVLDSDASNELVPRGGFQDRTA